MKKKSLRVYIICFLIIVAAAAGMTASLTFSKISVSYDVAVGEVCPEDIYASRSITDSVTTAARKKAAENAVSDVYVIDSAATESAAASVREFISSLYSIRSAEEESSKFELLKVSTKLNLSDDVLNKALYLSESQYQLLNAVPAYIEEVMTNGVTDLDKGQEEFNSLLESHGFAGNLFDVASAVASEVIRVNKTVNVEATDKARVEASAAVSDVTYMKNQIIVRRGEIISSAQYAMLKELGFIKGVGSIDIFHTISFVSMLLLTLFTAVFYYFAAGRRHITASPIAVSIICSSLALVGAAMSYFGAAGSSSKLIYLMPFTLCPALITLLLNNHLAMIVNLLVAVTAAVQTGDYVIGFSVAIIGVFTAIAFSNVRRRSHLLPATCYSALFCGAIYAATCFDSVKNIIDILKVSALGTVGAFFGGILTIGTIPFWEAIFDVITPMKLGELSNPEHKLLKKLLLKAPGSYHHSLTVANMSEAAANAIGANALLARVGAYDHHNGKTENPMYFKENQLGSLNPHDSLPPEESAKIIIKHVKDGAALADSYRLPSAVRDIILQHHGTTTASYFLYKAKALDENTDPAIYTYPGPTPVTKEASIIMLADACEAAVRAMREKGDIDAREAVEKIVSGRIEDGQLSGSELTFSDLEKVKDSFAKTLDQYFHKRIIYPQNKTENEAEVERSVK